jgi:hypothetical protein
LWWYLKEEEKVRKKKLFGWRDDLEMELGIDEEAQEKKD